MNAFTEHLEWASRVVAGWPEWKRNVLGSMILPGSTPREGGLMFDNEKVDEVLAEISASSVGRKLEDVQREAGEAGFRIRVVSRDGHACIVTQDFRLDRVNVHVVDGFVTAVKGLG